MRQGAAERDRIYLLGSSSSVGAITVDPPIGTAENGLPTVSIPLREP